MPQRFTVISTTLASEHCEDGSDHTDMRLVPEMPNSGNQTYEQVLGDVNKFLQACAEVQKANAIKGIAPIGNPPVDKEVSLPLASALKRPYSLLIDPATLRSRIWAAFSAAHQADMRASLVESFGKKKAATGQRRRVKGFAV